MAGYCAAYGDGLSLGGYCSSFVAADRMVFVKKDFADVREFEATLKILVRVFCQFGLLIVKLSTSKLCRICLSNLFDLGSCGGAN